MNHNPLTDYITKASLEAQGTIDLLIASLEKEKQFTKYPDAKDRQIEWVNSIQSEIATIFEHIDKFEDIIMRLEGCCMAHGIGTFTIKDFKMKPMINVVNDVKRSQSRQYLIPFYLVDCFDGPAEVKTADKPTLKWTYVDGKLTPDMRLKPTMPTVKDIIEGRNI